MNKYIKYPLIFLFILGFVSFYYLNNPQQSFFMPKCYVLTTTGYKCFGCGMQTAIYHILHFEFIQAIKANALFCFLLLYIIPLLFFEKSFKTSRFKQFYSILYSQLSYIIIAFFAIIFLVLRNL